MFRTLDERPSAERHVAAAPARRALRFLTAGSVDDGKSTLIGRLLFDSRAILADQLDSLERRAAGAPIDLSLLTDGLEAEREQGITIDVAYRYFATRRRKFIIADAPGHEQYTRNMVTAAAGSDAAVVLVDITKLDLSVRPVRLLAQTRRHTLLAQLLRVPGIVFAVNKIDAVANPGEAWAAVRDALQAFADEAGITLAGILPVSALRGDNVAQPMEVPWYRGPSLLQLLESLPAAAEQTTGAFSLAVQLVGRTGASAPGDVAATGVQHRIFWGRIAGGRVSAGDEVQVFPSGERARVLEVLTAAGDIGTAEAGISAGLVLERQLDVARGDWIGSPGALTDTRRFAATPGSTPNPPSWAAATRCAMATAGCRRASPRSKAGSTSTPWRRCPPRRSASMKSATSSSSCNSRCRSARTKRTASPAR
jgi:sulfate adenylyltransferase subunit 1